MAPRKKKDFSEAVAASSAPDANGAKTVAERERIERKRYKEKLPVSIAPEIVVMRADELAKAVRERETFMEERRAANAEAREHRAHLDEKISELATSVEQHTEVRDVECVEYLIQGTGTMEVVRQDTMEVVSTKAAAGEDLQETIFGKSTPKPPKAASGIFDDDDDGAEIDGASEKWTEGANPKPVDASP